MRPRAKGAMHIVAMPTLNKNKLGGKPNKNNQSDTIHVFFRRFWLKMLKIKKV